MSNLIHPYSVWKVEVDLRIWHLDDNLTFCDTKTFETTAFQEMNTSSILWYVPLHVGHLRGTTLIHDVVFTKHSQNFICKRFELECTDRQTNVELSSVRREITGDTNRLDQ